jgi:hypothetical protein
MMQSASTRSLSMISPSKSKITASGPAVGTSRVSRRRCDLRSELMTTWERLRQALRREKRDVDEAIDEMKDRANAALDQRERERDATPSERLEMEQARARDIDDDIEAIRRKIERSDG